MNKGKLVAAGFSCMDVYEKLNKSYPTGNGVNWGVHLRRMGVPVSVVSVVGNDSCGNAMKHMLTEEVHNIVESSPVKNGFVLVVTAHTTTGIVVNEGLPCVETDIADMLAKLVPMEAPYAHAHFLPGYGATGNNSTGHLKSLLCGNHCMFPVVDGKIVCDSAQDIYLVEFDGP